MSTEQQEALDAILRQSAFPADADVNEQRRPLKELISAQPLPADVTVTAAALGDVPTAEITIDRLYGVWRACWPDAATYEKNTDRKFPGAVITVWRTQSQALPRFPSVASMVDE